MKHSLLVLLLISTAAQADAPWIRDCVTWWGGDIAREQRTEKNCPNKTNHWDLSGTGPSTVTTASGIVITNNSTYVVNRVGNTVTVIQSGKR